MPPLGSIFQLALKTLVFIGFGGAVLYAMAHFDLFDMTYLARAFQTGSTYVALTIASLVTLLFLNVARYLVLLRVFKLNIAFKNSAAATCVSMAAGQWLPGSMAVAEVLRVGLMMGALKKVDSSLHGGGAGISSPRSRIAVASFVDRAIGLFVIFAVGALVSSALVFQQLNTPTLKTVEFYGLCSLAVFTIFASVGVALLPVLARWEILRSLSGKVRSSIEAKQHSSSDVEVRFFYIIFNFLLKVFSAGSSLRASLVEGTSNPTKLLAPILVSVSALFFLILSFYLSSLAIGNEMSLFAISAAFPVLALSQLLPIGIGGIGGQQLIAVAVFNVFGISANIVSSASLLQSGLWLLVVTGFGILFARVGMKQIKAAISQKNL